MNAGKPSARLKSTKSPPPGRRKANKNTLPENPPRGFSSKGVNLKRNPRPDYIPPKRSWLERLESGLNRHRKARRPQKKIAKIPSPIEKIPPDPYDYKGLWDDQVMMSIGVVWDALRQNDILFALSPLEDLQLCRKKGDTGGECRVALGPNPFIIPLTFSSAESQNVGQLSHQLLAVAQVTDSGPIKIKLMDSSPGRIAKEHIHAAIAGLIMYSGWLRKNGTRPSRVWPAIEFDECLVPEQELVNACGLNVVLNAWAQMLNIPINHRRHRVKSCKDGSEEKAESEDFLRKTIEIIDLAISGHMDTETILAFMIWYGYADSRIPLNPEDRDDINYVPQLELAPLAKSIEDIIDLVNEEVTPTRFDDSYYLYNKPNQDDVRFLMKEAHCTKNQAGKALEDANKDMRIARWFVPVTRNHLQKVETLMREMGCSANEAEEALDEANGNSRMAHFWVQAAWRRQEEGERIRIREEAQNRIQQQGRRRELDKRTGLSQASAGFDSPRNESTAETGDEEENEEDEEDEDEEEEEDDEEEEGEDEDDDDDDDYDARLRLEDERDLDRVKAVSLLGLNGIELNDEEKEDPLMDEEEREQLQKAIDNSLIGTPATPAPAPAPAPRRSSSLLSSPAPAPSIQSISSTPAAEEQSDFSGNKTPTALTSSLSSSSSSSSSRLN